MKLWLARYSETRDVADLSHLGHPLKLSEKQEATLEKLVEKKP